MNKGILILVVEDDPPIRNLITTTLKTQDYKYITADNGNAAVMQSGNSETVFVNGRLRVDYAACSAWMRGEELHLTPIEYKLLCLLSHHVGKVLTHTFITQQIWGSSLENDIASLRVFMATLRKKLEAGEDVSYIQTHIGIGYRMLKVDQSEGDDGTA